MSSGIPWSHFHGEPVINIPFYGLRFPVLFWVVRYYTGAGRLHRSDPRLKTLQPGLSPPCLAVIRPLIRIYGKAGGQNGAALNL